MRFRFHYNLRHSSAKKEITEKHYVYYSLNHDVDRILYSVIDDMWLLIILPLFYCILLKMMIINARFLRIEYNQTTERHQKV